MTQRGRIAGHAPQACQRLIESGCSNRRARRSTAQPKPEAGRLTTRLAGPSLGACISDGDLRAWLTSAYGTAPSDTWLRRTFRWTIQLGRQSLLDCRLHIVQRRVAADVAGVLQALPDDPGVSHPRTKPGRRRADRS